MQRQHLTKDKIVQASIEMIEKGEPLTFSTIARHLATSSQALYNYFGNLKDLRYAIVAKSVNNAVTYVQSEAFGHAGLEGLLSFTMALRKLCFKNQALSQFVVTTPRSKAYPDVTAAFDRLKKLLDQMLATHFTDEHQRLLASRFIRDLTVGDVMNIWMGWFADPSFNVDDSFTTMLALALKMLDEPKK